MILLSSVTYVMAESEPNNTSAQANPLSVNGSDSGTLNSSTDVVDWWKVTLPSDGKLVVATLSDAALEIDNYLFDQDGTTQIAKYAYGGSHTWDTVYYVNLRAGTYYIKSLAYSGSSAYTITNRFYPANLQNDPENNDSAQVANALTLYGSTTGHLGFFGAGYTDVNDWWKVTVPSDGKLVIATLSDSTIEIDNSIYDQDKQTLLANYAYGGYHLWDTSYYVKLVQGTYYIKTFRYSGYGSYTITSNFTPAKYQNDLEPNDSASVATQFVLNGTETGHLGFYSLGKTDIYDWRKITVPSDGKLVIATLSDSTIELDNYIYDQDKETLIASYAYPGSHLWDTVYFNNIAPGTYYIQTFNYSGYGSYTIANKFTPTAFDNDVEPNNSISTAQNIPVATRKTGHLGYYNNGNYDMDDYFSFTVQSQYDTVFVRTDSDSLLEVDLNLYNSTGSLLAHAGAYGTSEILTYEHLQPGTYYVNATRFSGYGAYGILVSNLRPTFSVMGIATEQLSFIPKEYSLNQNFPNPFNPSTTIKYALPKSSKVTIKVYDIIGHEIATLVDGEQKAGNHSVEFDAVGLPTGVYLYVLKSGSFVQSRKMMLLK